MVNIDQTDIYLVPMVKGQTWKKTGQEGNGANWS
jgi:hypothetical protein